MVWSPEPVGTWEWPEEAVKQFAPENGIDLTQVRHILAKKWLWRCSRGHEWQDSAGERMRRPIKKWRKIAGLWGCPVCAVEDYGPVRECGHQDPSTKMSFSLGVLQNPRAVMGGKCIDCRPSWRCAGAVPISGGDPDRDCPECEASAKKLLEHPDRQRFIDTLGLGPHQATYFKCEFEDHQEVRLTYYGAAHGYGCRQCWKAKQSDGWSTPAGEMLRVNRPLSSSKLETRVREYLSRRLAVIPLGDFNAVSIEGLFFGRGEVTPDILLAGKVAVEVDSPGRDGEAHRGVREESDRMKDVALRDAGWRVIRVRLSGLEALDSATDSLVAKSITNDVLEELTIRSRNLGAEWRMD